MDFSFMLPWLVSFLVLLVVLMFLIRHLLREKEMAGAGATVDDELRDP
jgi:hypothetical protein